MKFWFSTKIPARSPPYKSDFAPVRVRFAFNPVNPLTQDSCDRFKSKNPTFQRSFLIIPEKQARPQFIFAEFATMRHQQHLCDLIRHRAGSLQQAAIDMSELLGLSMDAAYRRMRGETALTYEEAAKIALHYRLQSQLFESADNAQIRFHRRRLIDSTEAFAEYLETSLAWMESFPKMQNARLIYSAKDVPIYYQFGYPELTRFKFRVWMNNLYGLGQREPEADDAILGRMMDLAARLNTAYRRVPVTEIWNDSSIFSLVKQLEYYWFIEAITKAQVHRIIEDAEAMIETIDTDARAGCRCLPDGSQTAVDFEMYYHEVLIMDNHILLWSESVKTVFLSWGGLNFLHSSEVAMVEDMKRFLDGQCRRSVPMSKVNERDRSRWKNRTLKQLEDLRSRIQ